MTPFKSYIMDLDDRILIYLNKTLSTNRDNLVNKDGSPNGEELFRAQGRIEVIKQITTIIKQYNNEKISRLHVINQNKETS